MKTIEQNITDVVDKTIAYGTTQLVVLQLQAVEKSTTGAAQLLSRSLCGAALAGGTVFCSTALALWLGHLLGKNYFGFAIVGGGYFLLGLLALLFHRSTSASIKNYLLSKLPV